MKIEYRPLSWFDDCARFYISPTTPEDFFIHDPMTTMTVGEFDWRFRSDWHSRYFCRRLKIAREKLKQ
jgi:hypothetical protein